MIWVGRTVTRFSFESRRFTSVHIRSRQWPFIDRPSVNQNLRDAIEKGSATWIIGGVGSGKSELISRYVDNVLKDKSDTTLAFIFDFKLARQSELDDFARLKRLLVRMCVTQLASQMAPKAISSLLVSSNVGIEDSFERLARSRPLWSHLADNSKSMTDLWSKLVHNQASALEILPLLRLAEDPSTELEMWLNILSKSGRRVAVCFLHAEVLPLKDFNRSPLLDFINRRDLFSVVIECNDALKTIWNKNDGRVIQVPDLPKEALNAVFVPSLLSDDVHVDTLFSMCGGRVGLLEKLVVPLNILSEQQRLENEQVEQRYRTGKEIRPSTESKELQLDPLLYKREVTLRDMLIDGALKGEVDDFAEKLERMLTSFEPLTAIRASMTDIEFKVLICETFRVVVSILRKNSSITIPAGKTPSDIGHPVILGLLHSNILMVNWLPIPRLQIESPLKLFLLESWFSAYLDDLPLQDRVQYNLSLTKNRVHLSKQIDRLVV